MPEGVEPERFAQRLVFLMAHVKPGDRVLDLGCGDGAFAAELVTEHARVVGADVSRAALGRAAKRAPGAELVELDEGRPLPFADDAFDVVWAGETIEHVVDVVGWLAEVRRVLRFGGKLLVTTPYHGRVATVALGLRAGAFDSHFDPRADHLRFFSARTLRALLADAGFPDVEIRAHGGLPLLRRAFHVCAS
jgi:2-polyprenyl-6-hydroxyphenyl methylase/3-demethylubiquinone-9 3-methyltransferase